MSAANCLLSEDQFLCSICLDVFTDPVSTPCGHNFCKSCISQHWNISTLYNCPICKRHYGTRPELHVNTFISEMAAQFKLSVQQQTRSSSSSSKKQHARPGEVPCDVCTGTKLKALKSCLVCLASYCETHLEPHQTFSGLKRHQLIEPVKNMEGRICQNHDKPLEMFCKTEQMFVCIICSVLNHKTHCVVPLKEEYEELKAGLWIKEAELQMMIQNRLAKIQDIKYSMQLSKEEAEREMEGGVAFFTALIEAVERKMDEFMETIKQKQRRAEIQAESFIKELEQEIFELTKRISEVEQFSHSQDPLQMIQNFSAMTTAPPTKDWTDVSVHKPSYEGMVVKAVSQLETTLNNQMMILFETELKRVRQYRKYVLLDPDLVHPHQTKGNECRCVLSKQGFTSGRFYFDVKVDKWSTWTLGVARKTDMKGQIRLSPNNGFWTLCLSSSGYAISTEPTVHLSLRSKPEKLGVYVHYDKGLVCFFNVSTAALIFSFTDCSFTEELFPFFSPCLNDGVHIHTPEFSCLIQ